MPFHPVEVVLVLVAISVALGVMARRIGIPYPILLVIGGLILGLQPWVPPVVRSAARVPSLLTPATVCRSIQDRVE